MSVPRVEYATIRTLGREFLSQFFVNEAVTSETHLRQAIIWVLAFLVTPGIILSLHMFSLYQAAVLNSPALVNQLTVALATLFVMYSAVVTGLIAAFAWNSLAFDKRDAMVLGSLPIAGTTIVIAKLGALALLLLAASLAVNGLTAVPFALVASGHKGMLAVGRHIVAHLVATLSMATLVFCLFVIVRGSLTWLGSGRWAIAVASFLQFIFVSAVLCFVLLIPAALETTKGVYTGNSRVPVSSWLPTTWFVGLYQTILHGSSSEWSLLAGRAMFAMAMAVAAAVLLSAFGLRRHLTAALGTSRSKRSGGGVVLPLARRLVGREPVASAIVEFVLTTIGRNRLHTTPIAMCAAVGVAMSVFQVPKPFTLTTETGWLGMPLMIAFFTIAGVRATFFIPSELRAAWTFDVNASEATLATLAAVRAALFVTVAPVTVLLSAVVAVYFLSPVAALVHVGLVIGLVLALMELTATTVSHVPFTRPYPPGHARLRSRWPLYALGSYWFAYASVELELSWWRGPSRFVMLVSAVFLLSTVALVWWRRASIRPSDDPAEPVEELEADLTRLDINRV